jgi:RES domain-containing protein
LKAFRIVRPDFKSPADAFSGRGGLYTEGRWNHLGQLVVYTSESLSLAELETIVHLKSPRSLAKYVWFSIEIPDELIETPASLPDGWSLPCYNTGKPEMIEVSVNLPQTKSARGITKQTKNYPPPIATGIESRKIVHETKQTLESVISMLAGIMSEPPSVKFGSRWLMEKRSVGLKVPSAILPEEYNLIVNPAHEKFDLSMVKGPFSLAWDKRLA